MLLIRLIKQLGVIKISIFDKFKFWKDHSAGEDNIDLNDDLGIQTQNMDYDRTGMPESDMFNSEKDMPNIQQANNNTGIGSEKSGFDRSGLPTHKSFGSQDVSALDQAGFDANKPSSIESFKQTRQSTTTADKELELISSKLDTIKLILNDLDRRIANLEKIAKE